MNQNNSTKFKPRRQARGNAASLKPLSAEHRRLIKRIISPGSYQYTDDRPTTMPTGETSRVHAETNMTTYEFTADAGGRVTLLLTPFYEAPLIRVFTNIDGVAVSGKAYTLPAKTRDQLYDDKIYGFRFTYASITCTNSTSVLNMQGTATVASVPLGLDEKRFVSPPTPTDGWPYRIIRTIDRPPITAQEVASTTALFVSHPAKEGAYVVLKHTDPQLSFTYRDCDENKAIFNQYLIDASGNVTSAATSNLLAISTGAGNNYNLVTTPTGSEHWSALNHVDHICATKPSHMNLGITVFEGLSPETKITVKLVVGLEYIPKLGSGKIQTAYTMPARDVRFVNALNLAMSIQKNVGTAKDNDFKSFLSGLGKIWDVVSPIAKTIVTALPPQYAMPASAVIEIGNRLRGPKGSNEKQNQKQAAPNADSYQQVILEKPQPIVSYPARRLAKRQ